MLPTRIVPTRSRTSALGGSIQPWLRAPGFPAVRGLQREVALEPDRDHRPRQRGEPEAEATAQPNLGSTPDDRCSLDIVHPQKWITEPGSARSALGPSGKR